MDEEEEDMRVVGVSEENAEERIRRRQVICPLKRGAAEKTNKIAPPSSPFTICDYFL